MQGLEETCGTMYLKKVGRGMDYLTYILAGIVTFFVVELLSVNIGYSLGAGPYDAGLVVAATSFLCAIVVVCTLVIVNTIKNCTGTGKDADA